MQNDTEKHTYHVDLVSGDVLGQKLEENPSFTVHATDEELAELKQCLEEHRKMTWRHMPDHMCPTFSIIMTGQMINTMQP
ncbi:hypothetical protein KEH51_17650 [[Brevibacterium] frigoritolerans]|uniref:Uncharacterized protein n=1 Tax=Peribacillus frigoritolerans TaxID=450367 RepID=A0A941FSI7_9BACI|nr:hypothetical protein [Peribacillus frigoritolerans]